MAQNLTGSNQNGEASARTTRTPVRERESLEEMRALNTFITLSRAIDSFGAKLQQSIARMGLTACQLWVLGTLLDRGPLSQRELSRTLLDSDFNLTAALDSLEQRGLVYREPCSDDRRVVSTTGEGRRLIEWVYPAYVRRLDELMSILSAEEQDELGRLCTKLWTELAAQA